jgi:CrcB protein
LSKDATSHVKYQHLLTIGAGGVLGAASRFAFSGHFSPATATLVVNVLGSILLGFLIYNSEYLGYVTPRIRMFFGIGFLGSFTTFSTFAVQTFQMPPLAASLNILENIVLAIAGIFAGRGLVIYLTGLKEGRFDLPLPGTITTLFKRRYVNHMAYAIAGLSILMFFPAMTGSMAVSSEMLLVGTGGFAGAALRFLVSGAIPRVGEIPAGTLAVNVIGSFVLAVLTFSSASGSLTYLVSIGVLGSFTTFSTFAYESFRLLEEGEKKYSLLNIILNLGICMAGVMTAYLIVGQ